MVRKSRKQDKSDQYQDEENQPEFYREVFHKSRDGFVKVDKVGRILDVNEAFCNMLGYSIRELRNIESFYEITPKKWHKWEQDEIWNNRLLKNGYSGIYEKEYIRKDGTLLSAVSDLLKTEFNLSRVSSNWYMIQ